MFGEGLHRKVDLPVPAVIVMRLAELHAIGDCHRIVVVAPGFIAAAICPTGGPQTRLRPQCRKVASLSEDDTYPATDSPTARSVALSRIAAVTGD